MRSGRRRFAVTHCHSLQSSNRSSPMDALIRAAVERVTGEPADGFDWSESLTTAAELARLLEEQDEERRIDLLFVTDHVNETTGGFHPDLVELAAREPRVALGAEIQTVAEQPAGSGRWVEAPEVLVYGGPQRVAAGSGWRYGLDEPALVELQVSCRPPGAPRAEVQRLLDACRRRGLAHALAHPLDGHRCDLATTLDILSRCRFVEVVNGGFSGESARRLERYVRLHNRLTGIDAETMPPPELAAVDRFGFSVANAASDSPTCRPERQRRTLDADALARWLVGRLGAPAPSHEPPIAAGIVAWGGSDAHLGDYPRVRVAWDPPAAGGGMADFLRDMVATPTRELLGERIFTIVGRGRRLDRCLREVLRLVGRNARRNRATFRGARRLARLAAIGSSLAIGRVLELRRAQARLGAELDRVLDRAETLVRQPLPALPQSSPQRAGSDVSAVPAIPQ